MTYQETTEYLFSQLPQFEKEGASGYKPGLERVETLLQLCGSPHKQLTTLHIAGSNGKGSSSTMLAATLAESGLRVGLFTSPTSSTSVSGFASMGRWYRRSLSSNL